MLRDEKMDLVLKEKTPQNQDKNSKVNEIQGQKKTFRNRQKTLRFRRLVCFTENKLLKG